MDFGLAGAAVCVSGGTKGLGREAALAFAREGARVCVLARGQEGIDRTVAELRDAGAPDAFGVPTDLGAEPSIDAAFREIANRWGELNTLINMAGPTDPSPGESFAEVPDENWDYYLSIGIMSVARATKAALPLLRAAKWGRVINISSVSSRIGLPLEAPYMTAKAGLNALSRNMAQALARYGILVNTVTPGVFRTEGLCYYMEVTGADQTYDPDDSTAVWRWMQETTGGRHAGFLGRVAFAREIAPLLLLLGSPANSYIVGANIPIDGGTDFSLV